MFGKPKATNRKLSMPIGMLYSWWAPVTAEPDNAHPAYGTPLDMGHARAGTLSTTTAVADIPGDDRIVYHAEKFVSASLATETDLNDLDINSQIYGRTYNAAGAHSNQADSAPFGAYAFIEPFLQKDSSQIYRAHFFPKVQANLANYANNAQTRGTNFDPRTNAVTFTVMADNTGDWQLQEEFDTEAEAVSYIMALFGATTTWTVTTVIVGEGTVSPAGSNAYAAGTDVTLTFSAAPAALYDNGVNVTASLSGATYTLTALAAAHQIVAIFSA